MLDVAPIRLALAGEQVAFSFEERPASVFGRPRSWSFYATRYRWALGYEWAPRRPPAVFIGLNPSTATAVIEDQTMRRMRQFAQREHCGSMVIVNLFAYRTPSPSEMFAAPDPVGPANVAVIAAAVRVADPALVIAAWGSNAKRQPAQAQAGLVLAMLDAGGFTVHNLGVTTGGHPQHPSRLASWTPLVPERPWCSLDERPIDVPLRVLDVPPLWLADSAAHTQERKD